MSERIYFCFCADNCKFETMTKEQIFAAIAEATGNTPTGIDDAFISRIKEQNKGDTVTIWRGTVAEYNALDELDDNCIYIKTDDTTIADINEKFEEVERETETTLDDFKVELGKLRPYGDLDSFVASAVPLYGYITSDCGVITFFLPLSKPISETVNHIQLNTLDIYAAGVQGLVNGGKIAAATGFDFFPVAEIRENGIKFEVHHATGTFTNAVNATPVVINANIDIVFTTTES